MTFLDGLLSIWRAVDAKVMEAPRQGGAQEEPPVSNPRACGTLVSAINDKKVDCGARCPHHTVAASAGCVLGNRIVMTVPPSEWFAARTVPPCCSTIR